MRLLLMAILSLAACLAHGRNGSTAQKRALPASHPAEPAAAALSSEAAAGEIMNELQSTPAPMRPDQLRFHKLAKASAAIPASSPNSPRRSISSCAHECFPAAPSTSSSNASSPIAAASNCSCDCTKCTDECNVKDNGRKKLRKGNKKDKGIFLVVDGKSVKAPRLRRNCCCCCGGGGGGGGGCCGCCCCCMPCIDMQPRPCMCCPQRRCFRGCCCCRRCCPYCNFCRGGLRNLGRKKRSIDMEEEQAAAAERATTTETTTTPEPSSSATPASATPARPPAARKMLATTQRAFMQRAKRQTKNYECPQCGCGGCPCCWCRQRARNPYAYSTQGAEAEPCMRDDGGSRRVNSPPLPQYADAPPPAPRPRFRSYGGGGASAAPPPPREGEAPPPEAYAYADDYAPPGRARVRAYGGGEADAAAEPPSAARPRFRSYGAHAAPPYAEEELATHAAASARPRLRSYAGGGAAAASVPYPPQVDPSAYHPLERRQQGGPVRGSGPFARAMQMTSAFPWMRNQLSDQLRMRHSMMGYEM